MVAALTLVVVGGLALFNALTAPAPGPAPSRAISDTATDGATATPSDPTAPPLQITVIGKPTEVFVKVSGSGGAVLQRGVLGPGETRRYDQVPLDVVVYDSSSVEVRIYGEIVEDPDGGRGEWEVPERRR
ncbi:hypothetical protein [Thermomonospora catenispora]|uniref:hypothetical protein n=1 Tax=Thermomonospora catenispora TaxID=2493090 RepID=UPI00111DAA81|nr:hypothetical protein [Thermomonospora catenispora]